VVAASGLSMQFSNIARPSQRFPEGDRILNTGAVVHSLLGVPDVELQPRGRHFSQRPGVPASVEHDN